MGSDIPASAMTLRDAFAVEAMAAIIIRVGTEGPELDDMARRAYEMAEAMLKARAPTSAWPRMHTDFSNDIR